MDDRWIEERRKREIVSSTIASAADENRVLSRGTPTKWQNEIYRGIMYMCIQRSRNEGGYDIERV